jgi:hypothetical protein
MSYTVRIRNNATGEIRHSRPYDFEFSHFWWTEGNFSCDCNREQEFRRGGNEDDLEETRCSDGRFSVLDATFEDGKVIDIDDPIKSQELLGKAVCSELDKTTTPDGSASST